MKKKTLYQLLSRLMFAGCFSATVSLPAQAGDLYQRYWQTVSAQFSQHPQHYRFREPAGGPAVSRYQRPVGAFYPAYREQRPYAYQPFRPVYSQTPRFRKASAPAFARQYAWTPARNTVFRRGSSDNFYASEQSNGMEVSAAQAPQFRSEPVSAQGLRFRSAERNVPFISFADRVRQSMPQTDNYASAVSRPAVVQHAEPQPVVSRFSAHPRPTFHAPQPLHPPRNLPMPVPLAERMPQPPKPVPAAQPVEPEVKVFMSSQPMPSADGFEFRPDQRFLSPAEKREPVRFKPASPVLEPAQLTPVETEQVQLARTQFVPAADNPWNNYTFRPTDFALKR